MPAPAIPHIWSAGDCTRHVGREGHEIRLECVQNAIDQAKHAALAMMGKPKTYSEVPWFWSDQYDLKLQIAGLARPTDTLVLRGDPAARKFAVFHLRDGEVAAVEAVNAAPEYMIGKKLVAEGKPIAAETLADTVHSHEADGVMAQVQSHLHRGQRQGAHRRGGRRLVADGRRGQAPGPRHRCRLRRRLRLRHLPGLCRCRTGRRSCRPKARWKKPCWTSRRTSRRTAACRASCA